MEGGTLSSRRAADEKARGGAGKLSGAGPPTLPPPRPSLPLCCSGHAALRRQTRCILPVFRRCDLLPLQPSIPGPRTKPEPARVVAESVPRQQIHRKREENPASGARGC